MSEIETDGGNLYQTGRDAVLDVCRTVLETGNEVAPRGMKTREVLGCSFAIAQPWDVIPSGIGRSRYHSAIGAAECLQDIVGVATPGLMSRISAAFPSPSGKWDAGVQTYGPRLAERGQLGAVVDKLKGDPDSRQAVALIWRQTDVLGDYTVIEVDKDGQSRPVEVKGQAHNICTIYLQFMVREGQLLGFGNMRSNDAWHGLGYDLQQFCGIQCSVANALSLEPGPYFHYAASMHLYDRHFEAAAELHDPDGTEDRTPVLGVGRVGDSWENIQARAKNILFGYGIADGPTPSEQWYIDKLAKYEPAFEQVEAGAQATADVAA